MPDQNQALLRPAAEPPTAQTVAGNGVPIPPGPEKAAVAGSGAGGRRRGVGAWLRDDISLHYADVPVLVCCAVSGLADSCAFNAGDVFVSMQTGVYHLSHMETLIWDLADWQTRKHNIPCPRRRPPAYQQALPMAEGVNFYRGVLAGMFLLLARRSPPWYAAALQLGSVLPRASNLHPRFRSARPEKRHAVLCFTQLALLGPSRSTPRGSRL